MTVRDQVWSAQDTSPAQIEAALRELLVAFHAENAGYWPARVLNMVCVVDRQWSGEIANRLRGVGRWTGADCSTPSCPAGSYPQGETCTFCPAGTYSPTQGSTACTACPAGTYSSTAGSTAA